MTVSALDPTAFSNLLLFCHSGDPILCMVSGSTNLGNDGSVPWDILEATASLDIADPGDDCTRATIGKENAQHHAARETALTTLRVGLLAVDVVGVVGVASLLVVVVVAIVVGLVVGSLVEVAQ